MEGNFFMKVGRNVTLIMNERSLHSRIIDIDNQYIYLDLPVNVNTRKTSYLQTDTSLIVRFVGDDHAFYQFTTQVVDLQLTAVPKLIVAHPIKVERIQRREFVRVKTAVDVSIHSLTEDFPPFTTVTYDISGGGMSLILPTNVDLPIDEVVKAYLVLPLNECKIHYISTTAKVLRIHKTKDQPTMAPLQFERISSNDQQKIVQFCLAKQREMRRKELL